MGWSLGFFFFFSSLLCGMKAWFLEQLCNHKGKAYGCWLGGVLAWLHCCSWFCESFQASCSMPDTHPAHIPSSRASDFKNFHCFFLWETDVFNGIGPLSSALVGKYTFFAAGFCGKALAGRQVLFLCIYCCDFVLKCTPAKKHFQHRTRFPLVNLQFHCSLCVYHRFFLCGGYRAELPSWFCG